MEDDYRELRIPKIVRWAASLWLQGAIKDTGYEDVESYWMRKDVKTLLRMRKTIIVHYIILRKSLNSTLSVPTILVSSAFSLSDCRYGTSKSASPCQINISGLFSFVRFFSI